MALGCLLAAWLTGCASSRQELVPPAAVASDDAPAPWSDGPHQSAATPPRVAGLALPGPWWESLQSPALSALIAQAQAASPTLATAEAALRQAEAAHLAMGCRGVSRSDFRYDDVKDDLVLLEVNTQPGMTPTSLAPEQAAYAGMSYDDLVRWMVEDASCPR